MLQSKTPKKAFARAKRGMKKPAKAEKPRSRPARSGTKQEAVLAAQATRRCNDRCHHESHGLAAAFGARLFCRRGAQAPQAEAWLEERRRQSYLPDNERGWRQPFISPIRAPASLTSMPRVKIGPSLPDHKKLEAEIARLRDLDNAGLRKYWQTVFRRLPPPHLPRSLLFRILAYRLQVDRFGDLDGESKNLLDRSESPEKAGQKAVGSVRRIVGVRPGTVLGREWNGRMQRVSVLADGFAWNGKTYPSLSQVAFAITGTRWNGPRFFGLRDKQDEGPSA
jgi:hypothetical protein